jgi:hypothetical protein
MHRIVLSKRTIFSSGLLAILMTMLLAIPSPLPEKIGTVDFRPYWSSTYLLVHGQDFSDSTNIYDVERELTGWDGSFPMHAWFAPTGNVLLLPYILFDFQRAAYCWFLTNIVIVFASALLIWQNKRVRIWIPLLATFSFSMTLLSFIIGQVNTVVLLGLALYFALSQRPTHDYAAGASLALTTIKAHLVILTLPILLLDIIWRRQWRILIGFVSVLLGCILVLYLFYGDWPISFWRLLTFGMSSWRLTPTIPGVLIMVGQGVWAKWVWILGLACAVAIWWVFRDRLDKRTWIDVTILGGMMVSPVGWSYDQIMLLFPILHILEWTVDGSLTRRDSLIIGAILVIGNGVTFYQRLTVENEVFFFWVPIFVALIYIFTRRRRRIRPLELFAPMLISPR